jgi:hypothetical protein
MKTRSGFVSNSSSCSFVISKDKMTPSQFLKAKHHLIYDEDEREIKGVDTTGWTCYDNKEENHYYFSTNLDNFCMISLIQSMGISGKDFEDMYHDDWDDIKWAKDFEKRYGVKLIDPTIRNS